MKLSFQLFFWHSGRYFGIQGKSVEIIHIMVYIESTSKIEGWSIIMKKLNFKKKMASMATKVGTKQAQNDLNQTCVMFIYQPKLPKTLKYSK